MPLNLYGNENQVRDSIYIKDLINEIVNGSAGKAT
jgi:dTDP-D-glucose 4,6-dehydratase